MKKFIPSLFTSANLVCGFIALLIGDFYTSSWFILAGMIFDVFDGIVARMLNAQSEIGKELDSMADLITFGVAPSYLYFLLAPGDHWIYYAPALILLVGCAVRLAIFNTLPSKSTFTGLATPGTAFFMFGVFMSYNAESSFTEQLVSHNIGYFFVPIFLAFLMLSRMEMFSLKNMKKPFWNNPFHIFAIGVLVITLIVTPVMAPIYTVIAYIIASFFFNRRFTNSELATEV